jgi:hypothetical protein
MSDTVKYITDTGVSGSVGNNTLLTLNYNISYIDLAASLYQPYDPLNVRGWFADVVNFNGYHLSNQYSLRIYLNQGQTATIKITTGTSRSISNLVNGQFIRLDEEITFNITREIYTPDDSDSSPVVIDSDVLPINTDFGVTDAVNTIVDSDYITSKLGVEFPLDGGIYDSSS